MGALLSPLHASSAPASSSDAQGPVALDFSALDERALQPGTSAGPTLLVAKVVNEAAAAAIHHHFARRFAAAHLTPVHARARHGAPLWRDVAAQLHVTLEGNDPAHAAEKIAGALASRPLLAALPKPGTWDRAVLEELTQSTASLVLLFTTTEDTASDLGAETFEIGTDLDGEAQQRWFAAAAVEAQRARSAHDLAALDAWWSAVERASLLAPPTEASIPEAGRALFAALALAARAWPVARLSLLAPADDGALASLQEAGITRNERGSIALAPAWMLVAEEVAATADKKTCARVADALLTSFDDPWSLAVAADLLVRTNDIERAEATHALAVSRSHESLVRRDIVDRWTKTVATLPADVRLAQSIRAGHRALENGEADEAFRWAQAATALPNEMSAATECAVSLLLGQSAVAMGDLVTGRVALEKARAVATTRADEELVAAELSEIAYASEDFETAAKEASIALDAKVATTRLKARNTLGKVLLARAKWEEAETHFADDACYAVTHRGQSGAMRTAELRARLNRGIAILSRNRIEEARAIFEQVLEDGEALHESRACAFAYENLAVAAMWRHDYGDALFLLERACKLLQRLGDKVKIAHDLGNLAQLRYKVGLFAQVDHAIAFGRRVLGPGMPRQNWAVFSIEAARLALARKRTVEAQREVSRALVESETSGLQVRLVGDAYRLAVRIALEDGDLARAGTSLAKAEAFDTSPESHAEIAYLKAVLARAAGTPDTKLAEDALLLVRALGEEELLRETHVLLFELHRSE
ncbi:MAG TPA: hypothetical protein VF407_10240, partial [Polyangiaceae bacterium]